MINQIMEQIVTGFVRIVDGLLLVLVVGIVVIIFSMMQLVISVFGGDILDKIFGNNRVYPMPLQFLVGNLAIVILFAILYVIGGL